MDEVFQRKWNEDVCVYYQSSRRLLHVRHEKKSNKPRELDCARRTEARELRLGLQHYGHAIQAGRSARSVRRGPQAWAEGRSLLFSSEFLRRGFSSLLQASLADGPVWHS